MTTAASSMNAEALRGLGVITREPDLFCEHILGHDLWDTQREMLRAIATHPLVAVKACHSSSKTFTAAEAVIWWLCRYDDGIVVTSAPTWTQVNRLLWPEIHRAVHGRVLGIESLRTELRGKRSNNYAAGLSTNEGVRFQGFHGRVLIVLDEAPGIRADIWTAIDGIRAGGDVHVFAIGNPVVGSGPFYDAFTSPRTPYRTFTISAFDTPNLAGHTLDSLRALSPDELAHNVRHYLVHRQWVVDMANKYGPTHAEYQARVLGDFPDDSPNTLYPLSRLELAARDRDGWRDTDAWVAGVDVAGGGEDETVVVIRHGDHVAFIDSFTDADARGPVKRALLPFKERLRGVNVDSVGMGHYFAADLRDEGYNVRAVNVGESADDSERFANLKAELYWSFRDVLWDGNVTGLYDELTRRQLASVRYSTNPRGRVVIESKDDYRDRFGSSPDRAEALILAFTRTRDVASLVIADPDIRETYRADRDSLVRLSMNGRPRR